VANSEFIPISKVILDESIPLVVEVLRSGNIAQGVLVSKLEETFAKLSGSEQAVAVNNGTSALYLALRSLNLKPGDEVLTSPFTFGATLNAILAVGATAKFVDISENDFNIDASKIESAITKKTKVILPVHLYGQMADMNPIKLIADSRGLKIVEDSAQSAFAEYRDQKVGTYGLGCFSFYATKNFTSSEGGMILTNNLVEANTLRILRNQGMASRYDYVTSSLNYRMTDVAAAILLPQLNHRDEIQKKRSENANKLIELLQDCTSISLPKQLSGRKHVWHQFTILLKEEHSKSRDEIVLKLNENNIGAGIYYPKLVGNYDCFSKDKRVIKTTLPVAESVSKRCFSIPVHQYLSESDLVRIAETLLRILN
jgi:perosamine synthetase